MKNKSDTTYKHACTAIGGVIGLILSTYILFHLLPLLQMMGEINILINFFAILSIFVLTPLAIQDLMRGGRKSIVVHVCSWCSLGVILSYLIQLAPIFVSVFVVLGLIDWLIWRLIWRLEFEAECGKAENDKRKRLKTKKDDKADFLTLLWSLCVGSLILWSFITFDSLYTRKEEGRVNRDWDLPPHLTWISEPIFICFGLYAAVTLPLAWLGRKVGIKIPALQRRYSLWYIEKKRKNLILRYYKAILRGEQVPPHKSLKSEEEKLRDKFEKLGIPWKPIDKIVNEWITKGCLIYLDLLTLKKFPNIAKLKGFTLEKLKEYHARHVQDFGKWFKIAKLNGYTSKELNRYTTRVQDFAKWFKISKQEAGNLLYYAIKSQLINCYLTLDGEEIILPYELRERLRKVLNV